MTVHDERLRPTGALAYWRAVARLPIDRAGALRELEAVFAGGAVPGALAGPARGRFVTTTIGHGLDPIYNGLARMWMPWQGKVFDAAAAAGRNRFSTRAQPLTRLAFRGYAGYGPGAPGEFTAFAFRTETGPSRLGRAGDVLRIDYDLPENPDWPIRRVLDELVRVDDGLYLGQALLRWRGRWVRAAWFAFEP